MTETVVAVFFTVYIVLHNPTLHLSFPVFIFSHLHLSTFPIPLGPEV